MKNTNSTTATTASFASFTEKGQGAIEFIIVAFLFCVIIAIVWNVLSGTNMTLDQFFTAAGQVGDAIVRATETLMK